MRLGMYIMAPESVSTAYVINLFRQSVRIYAYPPKLLGNGSVKSLPWQRIHTQQKNCWTRPFFYAVRVVSKESRRLPFPRTSLPEEVSSLLETSLSWRTTVLFSVSFPQTGCTSWITTPV
jgi:hypothetical protein